MPAHFDTGAEDAKLKGVREQEEEDLARILAERHGRHKANFPGAAGSPEPV